MTIVRSQKCRKIFYLERLLGRTILDFLNIRLIFLEAQLRRRQTGGGPSGDKKAKARTLNSAPVFGKVLEDYFRSSMDRLIEKLAYVCSVDDRDWIWGPALRLWALWTITLEFLLTKDPVVYLKSEILGVGPGYETELNTLGHFYNTWRPRLETRTSYSANRYKAKLVARVSWHCKLISYW